MQWLEFAGLAIVALALFVALPTWIGTREWRMKKRMAVRSRERANEAQAELRRMREQ